jgi:hypothetical protein
MGQASAKLPSLPAKPIPPGCVTLRVIKTLVPSFFVRAAKGAVFTFAVSFLACAAPGQTAVNPAALLTPEIRHSLEQRWANLQQTEKHNTGTRDLFSFVLEVAARGADLRMAEGALALAKQKREPDPTSNFYGNYAWYWKDPHPIDRNAVEFSMQSASLTWMLYRDRLGDKIRAQLESEIRYAVEGIRRHKVPVSYTNIFLMKAANCILLGEHLPDETLAKEGYSMLDQWLDYTRQNGIHEYSSPTYTAVDLGSLGLLVKYPRDAAVRAKAEKALRLLWTEIAANWFQPFEGIAGTHSRDYDFLRGHGMLDRYLEKAGWITPTKAPAPDVFIDLSAWTPPAEIRAITSTVPRLVFQRWGENPWEHSSHTVGRSFTLGSAGAGYGQQDKTLTVNLALGPLAPVVNFAMDERGDPYGQAKVLTGGGHMKLTHLVPFLSSVQQGSDALLLACQNPQKKPTPFATSLVSNIVFPAAATPWLVDGPLAFAKGETRHNLPGGTTLFLRSGDVAVALRYVFALDVSGQPATLAVLRDGEKVSAMRFTAFHSERTTNARAVVAIWVRVAEGLDDPAFEQFRESCAAAETPVIIKRDTIEVRAPAKKGTLRLIVNLTAEKRLLCEGADTKIENGILAVDGRDLGAELLK